MNTFDEIIEFAIDLEKEAVDFYSNMAARSTKPEVIKIFEGLVKQELGHQKRLENVLAGHRLPSGKKLYPDPDLKIADYVADVKDTGGDCNYQDCLIIAMKRELAAQKLYEDLLNKAENPELKEVFAFLLEEERKHKHQLESEYDDNVLSED